ncbi:MAG: signal recognition particle protein [Betaproteobacteria bacterium]|nr:signal recognition particle protein [Betaproteobacteria bacterium]
MLESVTSGLTGILRKVRGQARLTDKNIGESADQIRDALIDADVALEVAEEFITRVKQRAQGKEVLENLSPAEAFVGVVHQELTDLFGQQSAPVSMPLVPPCPILLVGLQGTGKTTSAAKLALHLRERKHRVLVTSTDVRRPAAIEQLRQLCAGKKIDFHEPEGEAGDPLDRARQALKSANSKLYDYLIIDSAGRNVADVELMDELESLSKATLPAETLLVLDATQGQEALTTARAFDERLALTGLVMAKMDGDARGGAALSGRRVLGVPIKLIGTGEKIDALEQFHPERMASRILGMGDIVSLVEKAGKHADKAKLTKLHRKLTRKKSPGLSLGDMIEQLTHADKIGALADMSDKLPGQAANAVQNFAENPSAIRGMEAIYQSMTPLERRLPNILKASRKRRIAAGAGVDVNKVNQLLVQHAQANKMMKRAAKNPKAMMQMLRNMTGGR